jgi:hypothetical protein
MDCFMPINKPHSSSGVSMLEILVGIGLLGLVLLFAYKLLINTKEFNTQSDDRMNIRSVARNLESFVDCPNVPKTCVSNQMLALPKKNGGILVNSNGQTVMAGWRIRALCTGSNQFQVQAARLDAAGNFAKDPITKQPLDWSHPKSMLFAKKTLCSSQPTPTVAVTDLIEVKAGTSCLVNSPSGLPCNPPVPPPCDPGFTSRGLSIDTFGGKDVNEVPNIFGQRWMRYCGKVTVP